MPSALGGKRNVKIFLLYLMRNIGIPLDFATLNDLVMQTDYVMYLDFAECFHELANSDLIEAVPQPGEAPDAGEQDKKYVVSTKGRMVADELHSDLLPVILDQSLQCALRYLDFKQRDIHTQCEISKRPDGTVEFRCHIREGERLLFSTTVNVDSVARAEQMQENFRARPESIYKGMWTLLSGNINYLFS